LSPNRVAKRVIQKGKPNLGKRMWEPQKPLKRSCEKWAPSPPLIIKGPRWPLNEKFGNPLGKCPIEVKYS